MPDDDHSVLIRPANEKTHFFIKNSLAIMNNQQKDLTDILMRFSTVSLNKKETIDSQKIRFNGCQQYANPLILADVKGSGAAIMRQARTTPGISPGSLNASCG